MLNKTSLLLAAAIVALSAGAASADESNGRQDKAGMVANGEPNQPIYGSGYNYGYDDGYARRERDDRYRAATWHADGDHAVYQRGAYYYGSDCNTAGGTIAGAAIGGAVGDRIGHGNGGAILGGVILGGIAGNSIARDMDCNDRHYALASYSAGFEGNVGERHEWHNGRNRGSFVTVREYSRDGNVCRDFREASYRGWQSSTRNGTACRRNDGNWYVE